MQVRSGHLIQIVRDGFMQSSHFQVATRRRLAILEAPLDAKCGITDSAKAGYTAPCGQPLDKRMRHTTAGCRKGVAKNRPHDALKRMLARLLAAAGAFVDEEIIVPKLCLGDPTTDDYMEATFPRATPRGRRRSAGSMSRLDLRMRYPITSHRSSTHQTRQVLQQKLVYKTNYGGIRPRVYTPYPSRSTAVLPLDPFEDCKNWQ